MGNEPTYQQSLERSMTPKFHIAAQYQTILIIMFNEIGPKLLSLIDSGKHISECGHFADTVRTYILREMVCGHNADIVRTYISRDICMSVQCPHFILLRFSALVASLTFLVCKSQKITANYIKSRKYYFANKRDMQITGCESNQHNAKFFKKC